MKAIIEGIEVELCGDFSILVVRDLREPDEQPCMEKIRLIQDKLHHKGSCDFNGLVELPHEPWPGMRCNELRYLVHFTDPCPDRESEYMAGHRQHEA